MNNSFFKNHGPFEINNLLNLSKISIKDNFKKIKVSDIKDLTTANNTEITFFHSKKYEYLACKTEALFCITTDSLSKILPNKCNKIIVDNVLISTAMITKIFYPNSVTDDFDCDVEEINKTIHKKNVKFGKNVLIGKNVKIGKNCLIGHNTILESNVIIGNNCSIGSNVIIRNTIIKNGVNVLDGCVIGKKGFGFYPKKEKTLDILILGQLLLMTM